MSIEDYLAKLLKFSGNSYLKNQGLSKSKVPRRKVYSKWLSKKILKELYII
jgi:hypothetical protein